MSLEEKCITSVENLTESIINGKEEEAEEDGAKLDSTLNNEKLVENKLKAMTPNKCEADSQIKILDASQAQVLPPPRKKPGRMSSLRKTDEEQFSSNQIERYDTLLIADNHDSNHPKDSSLRVTRSDESKLKDYQPLLTSDAKESQLLKGSETQYLSNDSNKRQVERSYVRFSENNNSFSEIELMERIRRWKTRWITSPEAQAIRRRRWNRFLYFIRVFLTHLFSTTGLCLLVVVYSCFGALIFKSLENEFLSKNVEKQRNYINQQRINCAEDLWNYTLTINVFYPEKWNQEAIDRLKIYEDTIVKAVKDNGYGSAADQWSFSGALLYSVTVITTIGYGNVTCKTDLGRIVTMIYALIGIPVMFLCLANLGNLMAETFRFSYKRLCCVCFCCCDRLSKRHNNKSESNLKPFNEKIELKKCDNNEVVESDKDIIVTYCENEEQKIRSIIELTPSTPPTTSITSSQSTSPLKSLTSSPVDNELSQPNSRIVVVQQSVKTEDNDRVPIWLVILLVIGYIMGGAFMFSIWEDGWGTLEGAYFCFTTLTTIGFGDLVPGSTKFSDNEEEQTKFIICCAYLIVGLSLLAMSFNLVQEEIVIRSKEIARRIGIIPQQLPECDIITAV